MNIQPVPTPILPDPRERHADGTGTRGADRAHSAPLPPTPPRAAPVAASSTPPARSSFGTTSARSDVQPPEGTDPKLWSILTTEERSYFARSSAQGPLTYARVMLGDAGATGAPLSASMRGIRLDVRG